jgi:hypothetical protein
MNSTYSYCTDTDWGLILAEFFGVSKAFLFYVSLINIYIALC